MAADIRSEPKAKGPGDGAARRDDPAQNDEHQSVDDEFRSLMEGLRTTLPGVQVLFAFLLTLPFQSRFESIAAGERIFYYVAFASAALATILLIAPSVHQRIRVNQSGIPRRHASHVRVAVRIANAGTISSVVALAASGYLVTALVVDDATAAVFAAFVVALAGFTWFYLPLVQWSDDS